MSTNFIARFSLPIIFFSATVFFSTIISANAYFIPLPYNHCFKNAYYKDLSPPHEEAFSIGKCFYQTAENILLGDTEDHQQEASIIRTNITTALHYADSWFRLAIKKGNNEAITYLHHTELYLLEDKQKHTIQTFTSP